MTTVALCRKTLRLMPMVYSNQYCQIITSLVSLLQTAFLSKLPSSSILLRLILFFWLTKRANYSTQKQKKD